MPNTILGEARPGGATIRSSGGIPILEETYIFTVQAESKNTSRIFVLSTTGLPVVGQTVSAFGISVCKTKTATRRPDRPDIWDVTCEFSSEVDERQNNQNPATDPVEWLPVYETKFERLQEVVTKDASGDVIANSAGQPFATGMTRPRMLPVWEFFQFESPLITDEQIADRNETVNSDVFKGRAAHTLLLTVPSSVIGFYFGARRRLTQYSLKYNKRNWKHKRLDVGTVFLSGGELLPYLDEDGNVISGGLNGTGGKVAAGSPPAVLEFEQFEEIAFADFLRI